VLVQVHKRLRGALLKDVQFQLGKLLMSALKERQWMCRRLEFAGSCLILARWSTRNSAVMERESNLKCAIP